MALPGLAGSARADAPEGRYTGAYSWSRYTEDKLDASKLASGSRDRYEIDSHQFSMKGPLTGRMDLGIDVMYEKLSGASPWYVEPDTATGRPLQVMSGATIEEERVDTLVNTSYYFDSARAGGSLGFSIENDYTSFNGGLNGEHHFFDKNTTLSSGIGASYDIIEPTDAEEFGRVTKEDKMSFSMFGAASQVLGRGAAVQTSLSYQLQNGYLSDPYKLVSTQTDGNIRDSRPDMRNQLSWLTRYRQHISSLGATIHLDYRFYIDDWEINSHTMEFAWYQAIWESIRIIPSLRYYTQSEAKFYAPYFVTVAPGANASSDYRLSPFGALSWRVKGETRFKQWPLAFDWGLSVSFERYISSGDLALGKVEVENPGLVNFNLLSVGVNGKF